MVRYFIHLSYKGTRYNGWQKQPNELSIQKTLEDSSKILLREDIKFVGAGRTDTGVHARNFFAHFDSGNEILHKNPSIIYKLNSILPRDIVVHSIHKMHPGAHARFDAIKRTYKYYIATYKEIFLSDYIWQYYKELDVELMNQAACKLLLYDDFLSFCKLHSNNSTTLCSIFEAKWNYENNLLVFTITADRFLRNMVRSIVGTLIDVGIRKISVEDFCAVIEKKQRSAAGMSVPPGGLFLENIIYPYSID